MLLITNHEDHFPNILLLKVFKPSVQFEVTFSHLKISNFSASFKKIDRAFFSINCLYTNKSILNLGKFNQICIVITLFRLIWLKTEFRLGVNCGHISCIIPRTVISFIHISEYFFRSVYGNCFMNKFVWIFFFVGKPTQIWQISFRLVMLRDTKKCQWKMVTMYQFAYKTFFNTNI